MAQGLMCGASRSCSDMEMKSLFRRTITIASNTESSVTRSDSFLNALEFMSGLSAMAELWEDRISSFSLLSLAGEVLGSCRLKRSDYGTHVIHTVANVLSRSPTSFRLVGARGTLTPEDMLCERVLSDDTHLTVILCECAPP